VAPPIVGASLGAVGIVELGVCSPPSDRTAALPDGRARSGGGRWTTLDALAHVGVEVFGFVTAVAGRGALRERLEAPAAWGAREAMKPAPPSGEDGV